MGTKTYITWNPEYSTHIDVIDEQHQKWIQNLNNFHDAFQRGEAHLFIADTLKACFDYTLYHFSEEEKLFETSNYPKANDHINEHQDFVKMISRLLNDYGKNNLVLSVKTIESLKDWLIRHILGTDKEFATYYKNQKSSN